ncbi:VanZ family protein [Butyrivibrio sp. INlla16]|uniref:VanZ family protein n=1 Tax=Butyrivibrio sp. INlla16 TaxID=1520807 RepID=UPI0008840300|nr:VanZ family protein [Butyrivibrio sp. INlla16]SDB09646.1 VanZ like family protein [Butyrivibrio sp. INlla16]
MISELISNYGTLIKQVLSDLVSVTKYMNIGIGIALMYGAVYLLYVVICKLLGKERKLTTGHAVAVFALLIYLTATLFIVFMSREPGQYEGVNLELWSSWGTTTLKRAMFIENIIMFIPMGILLPSAFKRLRNPFVCVFTCAVLSIFIELIQFVKGLGIAELDDVVTNTAGGAIGWLIWGIFWVIGLIITRIFGKKEEEEKKKS